MDDYINKHEDSVFVEEAINECVIKIKRTLGSEMVNEVGRTWEEQKKMDKTLEDDGLIWPRMFEDFYLPKWKYVIENKSFYKIFTKVAKSHLK